METKADVTLEKQGDGFAITAVHLTLKAKIPGADDAKFQELAGKAKAGFVSLNIRAHLDFMEGELGKSEWFAGDAFTGADIQMSFPVEAAQARGGLDASRPKLMAWLARIHARPAYKKALERGGPYGLLT
jgi:glutathione S-transferase